MRRIGLKDRVGKGLKEKGKGQGSRIGLRMIGLKDRFGNGLQEEGKG